jgi:LAO/AO transport system kinase
MTKRLTATSTSEDHAAAIIGRDRRALARAITMIESQRADHRADAAALLDRLLPASGKSVRLGISGPPGVGKSTFIENFGLHVIGEGHRLAVLASTRPRRSAAADPRRQDPHGRPGKASFGFHSPSPAGDTLAAWRAAPVTPSSPWRLPASMW